ncbi:MAG TPA: PAS domain-containing protein, partial [Deltaproteobacteria bacterium]|nr:PAS domain-containing protein [Deltaproteobacteria bacterium]
MRWTLQHKANAAILIAFLLIAAIYVAIQLPFQRVVMASALKQTETLLHSLVERDREPLANEIFEGRKRAIMLRIGQMRTVEGILNIGVFDHTGRLLVTDGPGPADPLLAPGDIPDPGSAVRIRRGRLDGDPILVYVQAIEVVSERIGFIRINYSLAKITRQQRTSYLIFGCLLGSIFFIMLVLLNYLLSRVVINPVTSLRDAMQRMHSGALGGQVEVKSMDEIGDLTRTFNQMSADLALYYQHIEEQNRVLKQSEKRLSDERERLDVTLRSIADGVIATDMQGRVVLMNHSAEALVGYRLADALGSPITVVFRVIDEDAGAAIENPVERVLRTGKVTDPAGNTSLITKDGRHRSISASGAPIIDNEGAIIGAILVFQDVTQKRLIEEEMAQMRVYLKNIIDSMPSMLVSVNEEGVIVEWNEAASRITGITAMEAIGREVWQVVPFLEKFRAPMQEVIATRSPREFHHEVQGSGEDEEFHNVSLFPLIANCVQGVVIRVDNITEMEKKEQQLRQAQKMETIGTLAGGLAHDFNNILGGITGSLSLIKFKLTQDHAMDRDFMLKYLGIMEEAGKRAADLVAQLLSISRKQELHFESVDLNSTIDHVMQICSNSFDKSIDLDVRHSAAKALVSASPTQMEQVLLNLCVNAAHAMTTMRGEDEHQGGRLTVSLRKIYGDAAFRATHPEAGEIQYWVLSVQDTGVGMETKTVAKIFDPFFTTKDKDKGTGLGLAMVYNIVRQHSGFIDVYSEPGVGSTFNVYLPVFEEEATAAGTDPDQEIPRGEGLILVADDEDMIRETARAILEECGYSVVL